MPTTTYSSGTQTDLTVSSGNTVDIIGTATAFNTGVNSGGILVTSAGGRDTLTVAQSGATITVGTGGTSISGQLDSGSFELVNGGTVSSLFAYEASQTVAGGNVTSAKFGLGATQNVQGGTVSGTLLESAGLGGGTQYIGAGTVTGTTIQNEGRSFASGGRVLGTNISSGGVQTFGAGVQASGTTVSGGGEVVLQPGANIHLTHLLSAALLDFAQVAYSVQASASLNAQADTLTVYNGGTTTSLDLSGNETGLIAQVISATDGSLEVVVACFCPGTMILTEHGEVAVEALAIGDRVVTAFGKTRAVRWIGRRNYTARFVAGRADIVPIRIKAGALGSGLPRRDLVVSPRHALYIDGCLIPAECLLNGQSVTRDTLVGSVSYVHVELDSHDVIVAEGAPSESFVDDDSRDMFHNVAEYNALYPGEPRVPAIYCAPRVESGYELEAVRARLGKHTGKKADVA